MKKTETPAFAAGTRLRIHRTQGSKTVFVKTGTALEDSGHPSGSIHFQDDSGPRVYVAPNDQIASAGQSQTITVLDD